MNSKNQSPVKKLLGIRGMGAALTAFVGLVVIYIAFGIINPAVFSGQNIQNLLRSMSKYLLIGIAQSYVLITGNIDLSIGTMVGMSAMISATLMTRGVHCDPGRTCKLSGCRSGKRLSRWKIPPAAVHRNTGHDVCDKRYRLHGEQQPKYGRDRDRNRQRAGGPFPELLLLWKDVWCV